MKVYLSGRYICTDHLASWCYIKNVGIGTYEVGIFGKRMSHQECRHTCNRTWQDYWMVKWYEVAGWFEAWRFESSSQVSQVFLLKKFLCCLNLYILSIYDKRESNPGLSFLVSSATITTTYLASFLPNPKTNKMTG